ncbi:SDR family oxidoreductase [Limnobacter sp.]|uniref:SDR family oxidoreductase n=1 Tax=Limnobacter sp. TaxID=2003368 RepID=UPI0035162ACB
MAVHPPQFALVTGGAKRLGRAIALELARAGWSIVLHCRQSRAEADQTSADIRALGVQCVVHQADLEDPAQVDALFDAAQVAGPVRCVVNNASLFEFDAGHNFSYALFERHMASNLAAPIALTRRLHAHIPQGQQGVVVNLLDQKLHNLNPDFLSYTLSKAGLQTATTMLAMELAPRLRVVGVAPGLTMISHLQTPEQFEQTHRISPLNRSSEPQDIAQAVLFAVQSKAITGTTLVVDGGQHLVPMSRDFSMMKP